MDPSHRAFYMGETKDNEQNTLVYSLLSSHLFLPLHFSFVNFPLQQVKYIFL